MSKYTVELIKGKGRQPYRCRIRHRNGKIILSSSEGYGRKRDLVKSVHNLLLHVGNGKVLDWKDLT